MNSISKKLVLTIILVIITINAINIYIHSSLVKKNFTEFHNQSLERLFTRLNLTLSNPIWNMQTDMIQAIISTEGLDSSIDSIKVFDEDNNLISQYLKPNPKQVINHKKLLGISFNTQKIATVEVMYNRDKVNALVKKKVKAMILEALFIMILLSIIIKLVIDSIITKKLLNLTSSINHFKETKEVQNVQIDSKDEIAFLSNEFNSMQLELKENWDNLQNINKTLEERINIEVEKNREKERQIFEQAKLAQMGEMIGNIAHQWRQPLSFISTAASSLSLQKEIGSLTDKMFFERMQNIIDKTTYLSNTIETFRNFIQNDKKIYKISINAAVEETLKVIQKTLENDNIKIIKNYDTNVYYMGYSGELSQVLLNIFNNSKDAFKHKQIDCKQINITIAKLNDKMVSISIEDNAGGIAEDILPKIFDPYFTTKHKSQGTGIGLYLSKDIIEKHHGGELHADNTNDGVKFTIILPIEKEKI